MGMEAQRNPPYGGMMLEVPFGWLWGIIPKEHLWVWGSHGATEVNVAGGDI